MYTDNGLKSTLFEAIKVLTFILLIELDTKKDKMFNFKYI